MIEAEPGAIAQAHSQYLGRADSHNSCRSSSYNNSREGSCERTGEAFDYRHRPLPEYSAMLVPHFEIDPQRRRPDEPNPPISEAVRSYFGDPHKLWNAVEFAEKRRDAQVARQIILALPASPLIGPDDRRRLSHLFAQKYVDRGLVVQLDIHVPERFGEKDEGLNWHTHLLMPTRRLCRTGLDKYKARDCDPVYRRTRAGGRVVECDYPGEQWRQVQDEYFRSQGLDIRVDPNGAIGQVHLGPVRLRKRGPGQLARAEEVRLAAIEAACDPGRVAETLTRGNATFTKKDVSLFLRKQLGRTLDEATILAIQAEVLKPSVAVPLFDERTAEPTGRYTTRQVRDQEEAAMAAAKALLKRRGASVSPRIARAVQRKHALDSEQLDAFLYAIGRCEDREDEPSGADLKIIRGRAGTGKSFTIRPIREAYEASGKDVIGVGPTHAVIQDMKADGFKKVTTAHAAIFSLKNGGRPWTKDTVVIMDEAAMLDATVTGELLKQVKDAGSKLILVGDERQLGSIKRGGLFAQLVNRQSSRVLTKVFRQIETWQQQASRDLAQYRFLDALNAFQAHGAIKWTDTRDEAIDSLIQEWTRDHTKSPAERRFVFAYENKYVNLINDELHRVRRARGELMGEDAQFSVKRANAREGEQTRSAMFAAGDRIQFTATRKALGIYNGSAAVIRSIDRSTGEIKAELDAPASGGHADERRVVTWKVREFNGFDLGYAGTIYKGQGKTFAQTYLLHTNRWQAGPSYVALTRHRKEAKLFVGRDTATDVLSLAGQMSKEGVRDASIAWEIDRDRAEVGAREAGGGRQASTRPSSSEFKTSERAAGPHPPPMAVAVEEPGAGTASLAERLRLLQRDEAGRKMVSPETRTEIEAALARWLASRAGAGGVDTTDPTLQLASTDVEALQELLNSLGNGAESAAAPHDVHARPESHVGEPIDDARAALERERRAGRSEIS